MAEQLENEPFNIIVLRIQYSLAIYQTISCSCNLVHGRNADDQFTTTADVDSGIDITVSSTGKVLYTGYTGTSGYL